MVERALVGNSEQGVLVPGIELLRVSGQGFGTRTQGQVAEAAFFELGKLAADFICRAGNDCA